MSIPKTIEGIGVEGAILAGGKSSRMGEENKVFSLLAGKTLLDHVVERMSPQVERLAISASTPLNSLGTQYIIQPDLVENHEGPLVGVWSCLRATFEREKFEWLAIAPCDAPFVPKNLVATLLETALVQGRPVATVRKEGRLQPTFSVWHQDLLDTLETAIIQGSIRGFMEFFDHCKPAVVDWPENIFPPPFFNVNRPADLTQAERYLVDK